MASGFGVLPMETPVGEAGEWEDRKMIVIKGGNLLDGSGAKPTENCAVVIEGSKITAVGEAGRAGISGTSEATEIDATDKTVMPGLIDSHLHLIGMKTDRYLEEQLVRPPQLGLIKSVSDAADLLEAGFTTVKDCGGFGIHLKRAMGEGTMRGPRILSAGYFLGQTGGHADDHFLPLEWVDARTSRRDMSLSLVCDGVAECVKAARYALREGADFIKIMASGGVMSMVDRPEDTQFTREEIEAIVEEAKHVGTFVSAHCQATKGMKNCIAAGVKTIDHAFYPDDEVMEMARVRGDVVFVPTLSIMHQLVTKGEEAGYPPWALAKGREAEEIAIENVARLREAGMTIAAATDFGGSPLLKMGTNAMELELLVTQCGFSPMEAIVAATRNGAEACGLGHLTGTIERGKIADILIVDGDPLRDIRILQDTAKIEMVMKEGEIEVARESLAGLGHNSISPVG